MSEDQLDDAEYLKTHGFSLFLFSGLENYEEIIGQSFVSYSDLLASSSTFSKHQNLYSVSDLSDVLQSPEENSHEQDAKVWKQRQFEIFMDMNLSVEIDVHSGRDLLAHTKTSMLERTLNLLETNIKYAPDNSKSEEGSERNPYMVVSFVSSSGEELVGISLQLAN